MAPGFRLRYPFARPRAHRWQGLLPFRARTRDRERLFKRGILSITTLVVAGLLGATSSGRHYLALSAAAVRELATRRVWGLKPDRAMVEADWRIRRQRGIELTTASLASFFQGTSEETRELFRVAGMDPGHALVRYGRGDEAFVLSPQVFDVDDQGRSYRFRPGTRSIWLRQITIRGGPFMMFQVPDTTRHRAAAAAAGAIVDEGSIQNTNSWGLRGPEPDPSATLRGIVLGDSFMQAMFNGDEDTPTVHLQKYLRETCKTSVSILNTGHIGYSPEQYYHTLREYGERFHPRFLVVSVCPNDFGSGWDVLAGKGDWYDEAEYWLGLIQLWCQSHGALYLLVPVPVHVQVESTRHDEFYPGQVLAIFHTSPSRYCFPLDEFIDEDLRLGSRALQEGQSPARSRLFNWQIDDDHFSPQGAALWARIVGRRLVRLLERMDQGMKTEEAKTLTQAVSPSSPGPLR
jgi:hypothetical protein